MDRQQRNPFQSRDDLVNQQPQQTWSFDRLDRALPNPAMPNLPTQYWLASPHLSNTMPLHPHPQRPTTTPDPNPTNWVTVPFQPPSQRPDTTLDPSPVTWHNPVGRRRGNRTSVRNPVQSNANTHPDQLTLGAGSSQQPVYPLGTREEVMSDDYVSPLASMYGRAWDRFRDAEQRRRAASREAYANAVQAQSYPPVNMLDVLGSRPPQHPDPGQLLAQSMETQRRVSQQHARERIAGPRFPPEAVANPLTASRPSLIDSQNSRPLPLSSEDMITSIACQICHEQKMDVIFEPCNHLAVCHWCWELMQVQVRRFRLNPEHGVEKLKCPICRRKVAVGKRVYIA